MNMKEQTSNKRQTKLKIKVCGMCDAQNIAGLLKLHPDFIGFIFHELSPRHCHQVPKAPIPKTVFKVGVFVNRPLEYILMKKEAFNLDVIQLHGNESPAFCLKIEQKGTPVIKAFNIGPGFDFEKLKAYEPACSYFLFDAAGREAGGNGITFNWDLLKAYHGKTPFLLSGGITPDLIGAVKNFSHPFFYGVDLNSGFEIKPGIKNIAKIKAFKNELST